MRRAGSGIIVCAAMIWVLGMAVSTSIAQGKQAVRIDGAASLSVVHETSAELRDHCHRDKSCPGV